MEQGSGKSTFLHAIAVVLFAAIIAARFFSIMDGRSVPDADECIVGLMGMHVLEGKGSPLYFYGQAYGAGAGLEARLCALVFSAFGVDGKVIKCVGLFLWSILVLVVWGLSRRMLGKRAGPFCLMLLAFVPQMGEWSMKLRGGHLPSLIVLVASAWAVWSLLEDHRTKKPGPALLAGFLAAMSVWSQPVSAPAAAALLIVAVIFMLLWKRYTEAGLIVGGTLPAVLLAYLTMPETTIWAAPHTGAGHVGENLAVMIVEILPRFFTPYLDPIAFGPAAHIYPAALLWGLFVLAAFLLSIGRLLKRGAKDRTARAILLINCTVLFCLAGALPIDPAALAPRHLLACSPFFCLLAASVFSIKENKSFKKASIVMFTLLLLSATAVHASVLVDKTFHNPGLGVKIPVKSVGLTVSRLQKHGFNRVFSADTDFTWNLIFESREKIIARSWNPEDRYQPYVEKVNRTARLGIPMAVVIPFPEGPLKKPVTDELMSFPGAEIIPVAPRVVVIHGIPGRDLLDYFNPTKQHQ